jgi:hypothetical protein
MEGNVELAKEWDEFKFCMTGDGVVTPLVDTWKGVSILKTIGMDFLDFLGKVI